MKECAGWKRLFGEKGVQGKNAFFCLRNLLLYGTALLPLWVCSKSSPLYPFNDWPDVNIFMTVGNGLLQGKLPYVDLIDHKGPYVYLLAAVGALLSPGKFYGYFLFECLSIFFFLFYTRKVILLYVKDCSCWFLRF